MFSHTEPSGSLRPIEVGKKVSKYNRKLKFKGLKLDWNIQDLIYFEKLCQFTSSCDHLSAALQSCTSAPVLLF